MINKIIDGISEAINLEFGDGYDIYTESIEQGLKEPCFSILCLNPTNDLYLGKKYKRTNQFMIQYFPSSNEKNKECNSIMERLYNSLEVIIVNGDQTRGTKMKGQMVDSVLNFQVNYDMFVYRVEALDNKMDSYNVNTDVRKDDTNGE